MLKNKKWLLIGLYNPPSTNDKSFISNLNITLSKTTETYDRTILMGDFNMTTTNPLLHELIDNFNMSSLIKEPTCFKSIINPKCIDLILTNCKNHFMKSSTFETGISDFHKLVTTILDINYVDFLQFQRYFTPQAELEEAFIYIIHKPIDFSIDFSCRLKT